MKYAVVIVLTLLLLSCSSELKQNVKLEPKPSKKVVSNKTNAIYILTEKDIENALNITKDMQ